MMLLLNHADEAGMKHGGERVAVVGHTACPFRQTTQEEVQI